MIQNLGIITACVPYLKPFIQGLEAAVAVTNDLRRGGVSDAEHGREISEPGSGSGNKLWRFTSTGSGKGGNDAGKESSSGHGVTSPITKELTTVTVMMKSRGWA